MTSDRTHTSHRGRRVALGLAGLLALLAIGFAVGESMGWPWLAQPLEQRLNQRLEREVKLRGAGDLNRAGLRIHLWGGVRVDCDSLWIGGPAWHADQPTLQATDVQLRLRYHDLWALRSGEPLRIKSLVADRFDAYVERRADGRASWQFGSAEATPKKKEQPGQPLDGLVFDRLEVKRGKVTVLDAPLRLDALIDFALLDRSEGGTVAPAAAASAASSPSGVESASGLRARATGHYRGNTLSASLQTDAPLAWISADEGDSSSAAAVRLEAHAGQAQLNFEGRLYDLLGLRGLQGEYVVAGPSLAAVGQPLGVTLPTTATFRMQGALKHGSGRWTTQVKRLTIGRSSLNGDFVYEDQLARPKLSGRLGGQSLWFADLGPTVGAPAPGQTAPARSDGKVLPNRPFDLPSLRAMDADVAVNIDRVELGQAFAEAIQPLKGRLQVIDGVLTLSELDARTAKGRIGGELMLDGRAEVALWKAKLQWSGLTLEQWIKQARRPNGQAPYVTGRLGGRLNLGGRGRSSSELLAGANGDALVYWNQGTVSHLLVEAAGIDIAQSLGLLLRGDDPLPVTCGAADLQFKQGEVTPRVMLVDTRDSTIWVDGSLSLATERMALRARVSPKDFTPLAVRTPIHVDGTFANPDLSLEKGPLMRKLVPAALLALINPVAGILPLLDNGGDDDAKQTLAACEGLVKRADRVLGPAAAPRKAPAASSTRGL